MIIRVSRQLLADIIVLLPGWGPPKIEHISRTIYMKTDNHLRSGMCPKNMCRLDGDQGQPVNAARLRAVTRTALAPNKAALHAKWCTRSREAVTKERHVVNKYA